MTIYDTVRIKLAKQLEIEVESINRDTKIFDDLGADSLDLVELIMELEEEYNIIITNDIAGDLSSVGAIVRFVESELNKRS